MHIYITCSIENLLLVYFLKILYAYKGVNLRKSINVYLSYSLGLINRYLEMFSNVGNTYWIWSSNKQREGGELYLGQAFDIL